MPVNSPVRGLDGHWKMGGPREQENIAAMEAARGAKQGVEEQNSEGAEDAVKNEAEAAAAAGAAKKKAEFDKEAPDAAAKKQVEGDAAALATQMREAEDKKENDGATTRDKSPTRAYRELQRLLDASLLDEVRVDGIKPTKRSTSPSRSALQRMMLVRKVAAAARIQGVISAAASRREAREQLVHIGKSDQTPGAVKETKHGAEEQANTRNQEGPPEQNGETESRKEEKERWETGTFRPAQVTRGSMAEVAAWQRWQHGRGKRGVGKHGRGVERSNSLVSRVMRKEGLS